MLRPLYDRGRCNIGVVHFGPGAFHRAHQAYFFDRLMERDPNRAISAVSLRTHDVHVALAPQDFLYTLAELGETSKFRIIGSIKEILVATESHDKISLRLAAPEASIVTITVTEKGYCLDGAGGLDFNHRDIVHDLGSPDRPRSLVGWLVRGLSLRRSVGLPPFMTISCDNLQDNGSKLARAVTAFAEAKDAKLAQWIRDHAPFPNTMVDSIVPATTDSLKALVVAETGLSDAWPVQRESFVQWVIEETDFRGQPDWSSVGVVTTREIAAYDRVKLRMLNASHSTLAYLGLLAGYATVADAMTDPDLSAFVERLMREDIQPSLRAPEGLDLAVYVRTVLARFRNPALRHSLSQIASDGSKKIPERILPTIADAAKTGRPLAAPAVPIAAWVAFVVRCARNSAPIADPISEKLLALGKAATGDPEHDISLFLSLREAFSAELAGTSAFSQAMTEAYRHILDQGPAETVRSLAHRD